MNLVSLLDARWGRVAFGALSVAGAAWWVGVALSPLIRDLTLGALPVALVAALDIPLFVIMSGLAALGLRFCAEIATAWTLLVAAAMSLYATVTGLAGWGALLMIAAAVTAAGALLLVRLDRLPSEWLIVGPFAAREARSAPARVHMLHTAGQILVFSVVLLIIGPTVIAVLEARWGLRVEMPVPVRIAGVVLVITALALSLWSARVMSGQGDGTPLPAATARRLVIAGPYRWVRNPMAVGGIAQGVAVGVMCSSWLVIVYALCGSLVWNHLVRPWEEKDLLERFGAPYAAYRDRVSCWIPRRPRRSPSGAEGDRLVY